VAELKTKENDQDVVAFLNGVAGDARRRACFTVMDLMNRVTRSEAKMWGDSIVGFGSYHYKYKSGREGDWFLTGFASRIQSLTLYIMSGFGEYEELLMNLGKFKSGKFVFT